MTDFEKLLLMIVSDFSDYIETGNVNASSRAYTIVLSQQFQAKLIAFGELPSGDEERQEIINRALLH